MDDVTVGNWPARKLGPSGIFEPINLDTLHLAVSLDGKLEALARPTGYSAKTFQGFLSKIRSVASAVVFHGGEVISDGTDPLTAIVITEKPIQKMFADRTQESACSCVMDVGFVSTAEMFALAMLSGGHPALRPFLSSELLVLATQRDAEILEALFSTLRSAFETHFLEDLSGLVCADVRKEVFRDLQASGCQKKSGAPQILQEETEFLGTKQVRSRVIDEREFERIAIRAMKKRRIPSGIQAFIMPQVKQAAGCAGQARNAQ